MNIHIETITNFLLSNTIKNKNIKTYDDDITKFYYFAGETYDPSITNGPKIYEMICLELEIKNEEEYQQIRNDRPSLKFVNLYCPTLISLKICQDMWDYHYSTTQYKNCVMQSKIKRTDFDYEGCVFLT